MADASKEIPEDMSEANRLVDEFILKISEHVDSVTVFVNKKRDEGNKGTWHMINGYGNWYARFGQILDWVEQQKAISYISHGGEDGSG